MEENKKAEAVMSWFGVAGIVWFFMGLLCAIWIDTTGGLKLSATGAIFLAISFLIHYSYSE